MSQHDKERMTAYLKDPFSITLVGGEHCPEGGGPNDTDDRDGPGWDARVLQPLDESDILDVMANGIIEPVVLRKNGMSRNDVQAGRFRVRWARAVQKRTGKPCPVPCVFRVGTERDMARLMVSENEHRIEDTLENRANKYLELSRLGMPDEEIAVTMRCTTAALRNYKKFFDLATSVQEEVKAGAISGSAALALAKLPRDEQGSALEKLKADAKANGHTVVKGKATRATVKAKTTKNAADATERPGLRLLSRVIRHDKADDLPEGFVLACRWFMGGVSPEKIRGLKGILRDLYVVTDDD